MRTGPRDRDPARNAASADHDAPVLAVRIHGVRSMRRDIDPGDEGGIGGQRGLNFVKLGNLARQRTVIFDELGLKLTQGDAGELALLLQCLEALRPRGPVEAPGPGIHQPVEPLELGGQFAEARSLGGCEPPVLTGGKLVEETAAQVFLQRLPCEGRLTEPGQHGGEIGALGFHGPAALKAGKGNPEPSSIQALHRAQPLVFRLDVFPLGIQVDRHIVIAAGRVGMGVAEPAAADLERPSNSGCATAYLP